MLSTDRRITFRVPLEILLNEYVRERQHRALTVNISESGLYVHRVLEPISRTSRVVSLEFELPGTGEVIWARGEVCHDDLDPYFHGEGIRFSAMPRAYARLLRDYCIERRRGLLDGVLERVRRARLQ